MDVSTIALLVCILFILFLLFILHKQRKANIRLKHIIVVHEQNVAGESERNKKTVAELKSQLLVYQLKDFDEVTSEYMLKIKTSPWKTFKIAAEQLNDYFSKVPEFYFEHKGYQRNRVFDGWAQELRSHIENARDVATLVKVFEDFDENPGSLHVKLMERIRDAVPVFTRGFILFEIWSRSEFAMSLIEKNLEPFRKSNSIEKGREDIKKMLNLQCLEGFFDQSVMEKFNEVYNRKSV